MPQSAFTQLTEREQQQANNDARPTKFSRTILFSDLVSGVAAGAPVDVALVPNLPAYVLAAGPPRNLLRADALMLGPPKIKLNAQFTGGGVSSCTVSVGTSAGPTLLGTAFNVFGGAASGLYVDMAQGAQRIAPADQLVIARFTPDGAHALAALTAGSCTIEVHFVARAASA